MRFTSRLTSLILVAFSFSLFVSACAPEADTPQQTLANIETQAVNAGLFIKYESRQWSSEANAFYYAASINWSGVGQTDTELAGAIGILKSYYEFNKTAANLITAERTNRLETAQDVIGQLQAKRNDILTKKVCQTLK